MEKILVTGPDGLLGSHVVRKLIERGFPVRAFVQKGKQPVTLEGLDLDFYYGDVTSREDIKTALLGCSGIIHIAAVTDVSPARGRIYWQVNLEGTVNVVEAALEAGISRMVHVGSAAAFGYGTREKPGTENTPFTSAKYRLDYILSKKAGQDIVLKAVEEQGLPAVVVSPTFMIGAFDSKPSSGDMIISLIKGSLPGYTPGGKNWIAVSDAAKGVCNALTKGSVGECYILGHRNLSYKEAFSLIAEVAGCKAPMFPIPRLAALAGGLAGSAAAAVTGKPSRLNLPMARISCDGHYFSGEKAVKGLDLPQSDIKEAVAEAIFWFRENGYLEAK